jgi:hypothetical protein
MKRIVTLLALILAPALSFAQTNAQQNEAGNTYLPANGNISQNIAVDRALRQIVTIASGTNGSQSVIPISSATGLNGVGSGLVGYMSVATTPTTATGGTTTTITGSGFSTSWVNNAVFMRSGTAANLRAWAYITQATSGLLTLDRALPAAVANGDTFYVMIPSPVGLANNSTNGGWPALSVAVESPSQSAAATGLLKLEDTVAGQGDALVAIGSRVNTSGTALAADGDYTTPSVDTLGQSFISYNHSFQPVAAQAFTKAEDTGATSGDAGVAVFSVRNDSAAAFAGNLDYQSLVSNSTGAIEVSLNSAFQQGASVGSSPIRSEDAAFTDGQATIVSGGQALSAIAQSVGASGDIAPPALDLGNRTIVTNAPAGETFSLCSGTVTDTVSTAIAPALASNRRYITSITCSNTSAVQSRIIFRDGVTAMAVGAIPNAAGGGNYSVTFPTPVRGSVNTAFNMEMATTATATQCCVQGFNSVI